MYPLFSDSLKRLGLCLGYTTDTLFRKPAFSNLCFSNSKTVCGSKGRGPSRGKEIRQRERRQKNGGGVIV